VGNFCEVNKDRKDFRAAQMVIDKRPKSNNVLDGDGVMTVTSLFLTVILDFSKSSGGRREKWSDLKEPRWSTPKREVINLNSGFLTQRKQERIHGASI
jgi:hypothetical protein